MLCFLSLCQGRLLAVPNMKVADIIIRFLEEVFFQDNTNPDFSEKKFIQEFWRISLWAFLSFEPCWSCFCFVNVQKPGWEVALPGSGVSEDLPAPTWSAGRTCAGLAEARTLSAAVTSFKSPVSFPECVWCQLCAVTQQCTGWSSTLGSSSSHCPADPKWISAFCTLSYFPLLSWMLSTWPWAGVWITNPSKIRSPCLLCGSHPPSKFVSHKIWKLYFIQFVCHMSEKKQAWKCQVLCCRFPP